VETATTSQWIGGWVGPGGSQDAVEKKNSQLLQEDFMVIQLKINHSRDLPVTLLREL
jgi:hypothetical protein